MSRILSGRGRTVIVCILSVCAFAAPARAHHTADINGDFSISLSELLRVIQFYNSLNLHCAAGTEDGFTPGIGDQTCAAHDSDYNPQDWHISLSELLRLVQFYNSNGGYETCVDGEDGYCPIIIPVGGEGEGEGEGATEGEGEGEGEGASEGEGEGEGAAEGEGEGDGSTGSVVVTIGNIDASPGEMVNVPLTITPDMSTPSIINFDLNYNDIRLAYTGSTKGAALNGRKLDVTDEGNGVIHFAVSNPLGQDTPIDIGSLAEVAFTISYDTAYGQTYPIFGSGASCVNTDAQLIDVTLANGAVNMHANGPVAPHASFTASPMVSLTNSPVDFTDNSFLGTGTGVTWVWQFGDGQSSIEQNPSHAYTTVGNYNVVLTVTTSDGNDSESKPSFIQIIDGKRIYVNKANTAGTQNGFTWATALPTLQKGIDAVSNSGGGEVWVAAGTYDEARGGATGVLNMHGLITLLGGFLGTETSVDERDPQANLTTIAGATARNGAPAIHVIIGADNTTIDGFTITGGRATSTGTTTDSQGGAIFNLGISTTISNCIFNDNQARTTGGAIFTSGGDVEILNCTFSGNGVSSVAASNTSAAAFGGAVYNTDTTATVTSCTFSANTASATASWASGAGITAQALGGGIYNFNSVTTISGCVFGGNTVSAAGSGAGMFNSNDVAASPIARGGGIYTRAGNTTITRSILAGNGASSSGNNNFANASGAGLFAESAALTLTNAIININQTTNPGTDEAGTGIGIDNTLGQKTVVITNCDIIGNLAATADLTSIAAILAVNASPTLSNCIVFNNVGVALLNLGGAAALSYCDVQDVTAGTGNISVTPAFRNLAGHDYHLTAASPCIDTGRNTSGAGDGTVTVDFEGVVRGSDGNPTVNADGSNYDIGAFEFVQ